MHTAVEFKSLQLNANSEQSFLYGKFPSALRFFASVIGAATEAFIGKLVSHSHRRAVISILTTRLVYQPYILVNLGAIETHVDLVLE